MKIIPLAIAVGTLTTAGVSNAATSVNDSINACKSAISEHAGLEQARYKVKKIKTRVSNRELRFRISANGQGITKATCKVRSNGEVLALSLNGESQPIAQARASTTPQS